MNAPAIQSHELVAVDVHGSLCACGVRGDYLEHLGDVALFLMDAPASRRQRVSSVMDADTAWAEGQLRRDNLASFSRPLPERVRRPKRQPFTLEQLLVMERVLDAEEAA